MRALPRSGRAEVRNPVLGLPAAERLLDSPLEQRRLLADLLDDLGRDAAKRAQHCWARHKAPMACYWKACAVYARHMARALRSCGARPCADERGEGWRGRH